MRKGAPYPVENPVRPGTNVDARWYNHDRVGYEFQ